MSDIVDFINSNYLNILIIILIVLTLLVIINIKGINMNPPKPESKLVQEVTVETFDQGININKEYSELKLQPSESFCKSYLGKSQELELECNKLTETSCAETSCCVFNNNKCVAGGMNGPTYKTDKDGKLITIDSYYYRGQKMPS